MVKITHVCSIVEAARLLRCGESTIRQRLRKGEYRARRIGRKGAWRIMLDRDGLPAVRAGRA